MRISREEKKAKAIELLKELDIYGPYIKGFAESGKICYFEQFVGFWVKKDSELEKRIQKFEEEYKCLVFAVTHELLEFGECYSFLFVSNRKQDWDDMVFLQNDTYYAFAYVWNKTDDSCSEFGTIGIHSFGGGIRRIA